MTFRPRTGAAEAATTTVIVAAIAAIALVATITAAARPGQFRPPLAERLVPAESGTPIRVMLPVADDATLETLLFRVTDGLLPIAIERVSNGTGTHSSTREPRQTVVLTGQPLPTVLDLLTHERGGIFRWRYDGNIVHVSSMGDRHTFLDTVVPSFELRRDSLTTALARLHRRFDPEYPLDTAPEIDASGLTASARLAQEAALRRPMTASLAHESVREILDALVGGVGDSSWAVHYASADGTYDGSEFLFRVYGGLTLRSSSRRR